MTEYLDDLDFVARDSYMAGVLDERVRFYEDNTGRAIIHATIHNAKARAYLKEKFGGTFYNNGKTWRLTSRQTKGVLEFLKLWYLITRTRQDEIEEIALKRYNYDLDKMMHGRSSL